MIQMRTLMGMEILATSALVSATPGPVPPRQVLVKHAHWQRTRSRNSMAKSCHRTHSSINRKHDHKSTGCRQPHRATFPLNRGSAQLPRTHAMSVQCSSYELVQPQLLPTDRPVSRASSSSTDSRRRSSIARLWEDPWRWGSSAATFAWPIKAVLRAFSELVRRRPANRSMLVGQGGCPTEPWLVFSFSTLLRGNFPSHASAGLNHTFHADNPLPRSEGGQGSCDHHAHVHRGRCARRETRRSCLGKTAGCGTRGPGP